MLRLTIRTNKLILRRLASSENNNKTSETLQYYAKTGGSCLFKSGVVLWLAFFPATQAVSYFGGASVITNTLLKYDLTRPVIEKSRKLGREKVPRWLGERFIEVFITGFSLYFCLKPVRYSMWFYLTQRCIKTNQSAIMMVSRRELLRKSKQRFNTGYGYFKRKNRITFKKTKTKEVGEEETLVKKRIKS